jgi:hypothetical protein
VVDEAGKPVAGASVRLVTPRVAAYGADAVAQAVAEHGEAMVFHDVARAGAPARFDDVAPGAYSLCVKALPAEGGAKVPDDEGDDSPIACVPRAVGAAPAEQALTIAVAPPPSP